MVLLRSNIHASDETNPINSKAIDVNGYSSTLNHQSNCQPANDVENFGLLRNNNGQTISINFKQAKMHRNATLHQERQSDTNVDDSNHQHGAFGFLSQFSRKRRPHEQQQPSNASRHSNKMQLIAFLLFYLVAFSIQTATARPNVNRNSDAESDWPSVALTSENKVSHLLFNIYDHQIKMSSVRIGLGAYH